MSASDHGATLPTPTLPNHTLGSKNIIWWGMLGLITIETVVVGGLIAIYFFLKLHNPAWPPEGIERPSLWLPALGTLVLIGSGLAMRIGDKGAKQEQQRRVVLGQTTALLLASLFLALKVVEYSGYDYNWSTHAYGSSVYALIVFHSGHVLSVVLKGLVVLAMAIRGMFTKDRRLALEVNGLYWQFIVIIWLPIFFTLYISPYL